MAGHIPVLLKETLDLLSPRPGDLVLDVTIGLGGHGVAFCERIGKEGVIVGLDADSENLKNAEENLANAACKCAFVHANFGSLRESLEGIHEITISTRRPEVSAADAQISFDIIFADLGLSSPHLDEPERGFSFRFDGPLDLRFDRTQGLPASSMIKAASYVQLLAMFRDLGEVKRPHLLAKAIVERRKEHSLDRTSDLKNIAEAVYGFEAPKALPQIFQAVRMQVNREIDMLKSLLSAAPKLLGPGGRLGIISYHSLEDRLVKETFRSLTTPPRDPLTGATTQEPAFALLAKKPISATDAELKSNPRSRSAHLRAIRRHSGYASP